MPRRKREDGSGQGGLTHVLLVGPTVPPTERVVDLAEQPYDRDRPEIPSDVHGERQALARQVLALTRRLDKAATPTARKPAAVDRPAYGTLRRILEGVAAELDLVLGPRAAPAGLAKLAKANKAPSASPPPPDFEKRNAGRAEAARTSRPQVTGLRGAGVHGQAALGPGLRRPPQGAAGEAEDRGADARRARPGEARVAPRGRRGPQAAGQGVS